MNKRDKIQVINIVLLLIVIALLVYIAITLPEEAVSCVANPMEYYEAQAKTSCYCQNMVRGFAP